MKNVILGMMLLLVALLAQSQGIRNKNAKQLVEAGADVLVAGNYVFKAENPTQTIADLKKLASF